MEEIAHQFRNELQALLNRYKNRLTTPQIMRIAQPIFTKTIGIKDNPERFKGLGYAKGFPIVDEFHDSQESRHVIGVQGYAKIAKRNCLNTDKILCTGDTLKNPEPVKGDWVVSDKEPL